MPAAEKPGKPEAPEVTLTTATSVAISWKPPLSDGGAEVYNYVVEYRMDGGFKWTRATEDDNPDTKCTITGLKTNREYEFRIAAENRAGVGPPSEPTAPVAVKEVIGQSLLYSLQWR